MHILKTCEDGITCACVFLFACTLPFLTHSFCGFCHFHIHSFGKCFYPLLLFVLYYKHKFVDAASLTVLSFICCFTSPFNACIILSTPSVFTVCWKSSTPRESVGHFATRQGWPLSPCRSSSGKGTSSLRRNSRVLSYWRIIKYLLNISLRRENIIL